MRQVDLKPGALNGCNMAFQADKAGFPVSRLEVASRKFEGGTNTKVIGFWCSAWLWSKGLGPILFQHYQLNSGTNLEYP